MEDELLREGHGRRRGIVVAPPPTVGGVGTREETERIVVVIVLVVVADVVFVVRSSPPSLGVLPPGAGGAVPVPAHDPAEQSPAPPPGRPDLARAGRRPRPPVSRTIFVVDAVVVDPPGGLGLGRRAVRADDAGVDDVDVAQISPEVNRLVVPPDDGHGGEEADRDRGRGRRGRHGD